MHIHSSLVPVFTQPLKGDKIQGRVGDGAPQAVHWRIFILFFLSLPFSSLPDNICAFFCDLNQEHIRQDARRRLAPSSDSIDYPFSWLQVVSAEPLLITTCSQQKEEREPVSPVRSAALGLNPEPSRPQIMEQV